MDRTARIWLPMFTLVLFSAGIATGVTGVLLYSNLQPAASAEERPQPLPSPGQLTALLTDELQLTPVQQEQLAAHHHRAAEQVRRSARAGTRAVRTRRRRAR